MTSSVEMSRRNSADAGWSSDASTGHKVGYARVSKKDQVLDRQIDALEADGCVKVFTDHGVTGTRIKRPGLDAALDYMRPGDILVVQTLDRLSRRTSEMLDFTKDLKDRGIEFRVLAFPEIDTTGPFGTALLTILGALAQMERDVLAERVQDGLAAARARGRTGGRPMSLTDDQIGTALRLRREGMPYRRIAASIGSTEATVRRIVKSVPEAD